MIRHIIEFRLETLIFYEFLVDIGLGPKKSKTLSVLKIPNEYFGDFLRGCIDGDGSMGFYSHPESKHPQLRIRLCSASMSFLEWAKSEIERIFNIKGGWIAKMNTRIPVLSYAKRDSEKLIGILYKEPGCVYLSRKYEVVKKFYGRVAELEYAHGLGPCSERIVGSTPTSPTTNN